MNRLRDKAAQAIQKYSMIAPGGQVAVGVSGGADSVALLHFLKVLSEPWGLTVKVLHLNHRLRGAESNRDEAFVRRLCWDWNIPLMVKSAQVGRLAKERGMSIEECARAERYDFFRRAAPDGGKVATAHTLSDSAETVLLNLTRGTALRGLCGIPPVRENLIRPFILCTRAEVEAYCAENALSYVTDSTNLSDEYTRNRLRHAVVPELAALNPGWHQNMAGAMESLRADADFLDGLAASVLEGVRDQKGGYLREELAGLPDPLLTRALRMILQDLGVPVSRRRLMQVWGILENGGGGQLSGDWLVKASQKSIVFTGAKQQPVPAFEPIILRYPFRDRTIDVFPGKKLRITVWDGENFKESLNNQEKRFKNMLDCDKIDRIIVIRNREPGDRIRTVGRGCTKLLKKMYREAGIPVDQRGRMLVLAGENGLLWAEEFGAAESAAAGSETRRGLTLEVTEG